MIFDSKIFKISFLGFGYDPRAVPPHMPPGYPPRFNPHHHYFHQEQGQGVFYHPRQPSFQYHGQQGNQNQQQYGQNNHGRFQSPNNAPGKSDVFHFRWLKM